MNAANTAGESTIFVKFMLEVIRELLSEMTENENRTSNVGIKDKLLNLLRQNGKHSAKSLSQELGISERQAQRILKECKETGMIEHVGANRNGKWIVY